MLWYISALALSAMEGDMEFKEEFKEFKVGDLVRCIRWGGGNVRG